MSEPIWFCGQNVQRIGEYARWPGASPKIPWHVDFSGLQGSVTVAEWIESFKLALSWWSDVIEVTPYMVQLQAEAFVRMRFARIDGPSGILAESELADNTNQPKFQRYDNSERWNAAWLRAAVIAHEWGHMWGLEHDSRTSKTLMAPYIQDDVPKPTERDFQRMLGLGYRKRITPIPPPNVPPAGPLPNHIRLKQGLTAGEYGQFVLGSDMMAGDYLALLQGDGPPPPIPEE